jgi:hypothetical protein
VCGQVHIIVTPLGRDEEANAGSVGGSDELGLELDALDSQGGHEDVEPREASGCVGGRDVKWGEGEILLCRLTARLLVLGFLHRVLAGRKKGWRALLTGRQSTVAEEVEGCARILRGRSSEPYYHCPSQRQSCSRI